MIRELEKIEEIYIACPEKYATGGTELLHQLYYKLKNKGKNVKIYYYNFTSGNPTADRFKIYEVEYITKLEDLETNLLIVPEIATDLLNNYKNIKKSIWWLSVDNYLFSKGITGPAWKIFLKKILGRTKKEFDFKLPDVIHMSQSHYGIDFLNKKGIKKVYYLSDYLSKYFFEKNINLESKDRKNIVLYNPKKGMEFTKKIIERYPDIEFQALENMTPEEIAEKCKESKIYIDFGNHPGKDRFPREAAILGCGIITGKKGSANFFEDVRIKSEYKFEDNEKEIKNIALKILEILKNYEEKIKDFSEYREMIKNEEQQFEKNIDEIFCRMKNEKYKK